jgi:hypothetical protein
VDDVACALFDNQDDSWQLKNLFTAPDAQALRTELHDQLCRAIVRSGEELPGYVKDRSPRRS